MRSGSTTRIARRRRRLALATRVLINLRSGARIFFANPRRLVVTRTRNARLAHTQRPPQPKMRAPFLLLLLPALTLGDFQVDLLITREVRGAVWPLNRWNSLCSTDDVNATPCNCFGGASRRQAVFSNAPEHVSIDTGSYFSGSGCARPPLPITQRPAPNRALVSEPPYHRMDRLYFPVFRGNVSAEYFAAAGYKAWTLSYRDFAAGASAAEPTGGALLARCSSSTSSPLVRIFGCADPCPRRAATLTVFARSTPPCRRP